MVAFVVDDLQYPLEPLTFQNGGHQHLTGAVPRTFVHFFEKGQGRMDLLECIIVIDVGQVDQLPAEGGVTRNALRRDRQLQFATAIETGLDLGDDGGLVFVDCIKRQAIGIEQFADILANLQHDLLKVVGFMNTGCNVLQLLVKKRLEGHAPLVGWQLLGFKKSLLRAFSCTAWFQYCIHGSKSRSTTLA